MEFTVLQSNFSKALNQVSRIVSARTTLPVLSNVLITAEKGKIRLSSTDLEVAITAFTIGKVEKEGTITIPARILSDFVANNHDESISFSVKKENVLTLKSEHYKANINGISSEEFPTIPKMPKENSCSIEAKPFSDAIKKILISPATDETRPVLAGVYFQFDNEVLTLAATDSFRLSEKKLKLAKGIDEKKIIVPSRTMNEVLRLIGGLENTNNILISLTDNQVAFKIGETEVVSRLIEGLYPPYTQIIPQSFKLQIKANAKMLLDAVKLSFLFSKNSANNIKFSTEEGNLIVSSSATETGETTSKVSAEIKGESIKIAFNARYILDILQVLSTDKVVLEFNDQSSAGIIRSEEDSDFIYIVMPLKTDA